MCAVLRSGTFTRSKLPRGDSRDIVQGLKEGQILRTISNMTYSDSHYTSDEDKLGEVSVCRPVPLLTLQLRSPLGRHERP